MLHTLLNHHHINDSQLQIGGTQDNVDGCIVLLDEEDRPEGKVIVQVKHLTYPPKNGDAYFDIPVELLGYASRFKSEVVLFITCDTNNNTFYWKCIDLPFIEDCLKRGIQGTYRYHFKENESTTAANVDDTLAQWRSLFQSRMDSIKDEESSLYEFMALQKQAFSQVPSIFFGIKDSFVKRKEIDILYNWVVGPLSSKESKVKLLVGEAGVGKTVVIKSLIEKLEKDGIKTLSIKADRSNITEASLGPLSLQTLQDSLNLLSSQQDKVVLIIDQIDALSQILSNDRDKLNVLLDTVASLKVESSHSTRVIVSCRKYDLMYDSSLKPLGIDNVIELGKISEADVKSVLDHLSPGLFESMNHKTRILLQTAQRLDMFCRLYVSGHRQTSYESEVVLFDELWLHLIHDCPSGLTPTGVEKFLYSIANTILDSETLSPFWTASADEYPLLHYLASEGVIKADGGQVSFFHQSFLDYTSARQYVQSGRSFVSDLEDWFQGLEIRSKIKGVLEYLRSHSELHYKEELFGLIKSPRIRRHIKLIAVSIVTSASNPLPFERKLVRDLYGNDLPLFAACLSGCSDEWFSFQFQLLYASAGSLTKDSELYGPISFFLSRFSSAHSEEILLFLDSINDEETRSNLAYYLLRSGMDFSVAGVRTLYKSLVAEKPEMAVDFIRNAFDSDDVFALGETKKLLLEHLLRKEKNSGDHDDYVLVEVICRKLFEERPKQFFEMMVECFLDVIKKRSIGGFYWYTTDAVFGGYHAEHDETNKLYEWMVAAGKSEFAFSSSYVIRLLDSNSEKAISLAFMLMACKPLQFDGIIRGIVADDKRLDNYLESSDFGYYFLELLKLWYPLLNSVDQEWYQERVLGFRSYTDSFADKERKYGPVLFFSLWRRKWELLYAIPDDRMIDDLRRCKLELRRRFGKDFVNVKNPSGVTKAMCCRGIVSSETYKSFSEKAWLHSFYGVKENRPWSKKDWLPFDDQVHAEEFSLAVSANPSRYNGFVSDLFIDDRVSDLYRLAGLKGMLKGGYEPRVLLPLFRHFMTEEYISKNAYEFFEVAGYFAKVEGLDQELIELYRQVILSWVQDPGPKDAHVSMERYVTDQLNYVINKPFGRSLEAMIDLASIMELRERIYHELEDICEFLSPGLRLLVFYKLYSTKYYQKELFDSLVVKYLPLMGAELIFLSPDLIQRYLYFDTDKVSSYLDRIHLDRRAHVILAQVYFFGISHAAVSEYCRSRLEDLLAINDEMTVAKMVSVSYSHIQDFDFSVLSEEILLRFANDDRKEVRTTYVLHCNDLPISSFPLFMKISRTWQPEKRRDWHSVLEYVFRCCGVFPVECYNFICQQHIIERTDSWDYQDDLVKVLLAIYKKLKLVDDREMLDKLMDLFDVLILQGNRTVLSALESLS